MESDTDLKIDKNQTRYQMSLDVYGNIFFEQIKLLSYNPYLNSPIPTCLSKIRLVFCENICYLSKKICNQRKVENDYTDEVKKTKTEKLSLGCRI